MTPAADFDLYVLPSLALSGVIVGIGMRAKGLVSWRTNRGTAAAVSGWFLTSVGLAGGFLGAYVVRESYVSCETSNPDALCSIVTFSGFIIIVGAVVPLLVGAALLGLSRGR